MVVRDTRGCVFAIRIAARIAVYLLYHHVSRYGFSYHLCIGKILPLTIFSICVIMVLMQRKRFETKKMNGSKWIRPDLRVAIIAVRDVITERFCPYCLRSIEEGIALSLDHICPRIYGGKNKVTNLITCCVECNSKRKDMCIPDFLRQCFDYPESMVVEIVAFVNRQRVKNVDRELGKRLLAEQPVSYWSGYNV